MDSAAEIKVGETYYRNENYKPRGACANAKSVTVTAVNPTAVRFTSGNGKHKGSSFIANFLKEHDALEDEEEIDIDALDEETENDPKYLYQWFMTPPVAQCSNPLCAQKLGLNYVTMITTTRTRRFCSVRCIADGYNCWLHWVGEDINLAELRRRMMINVDAPVVIHRHFCSVKWTDENNRQHACCKSAPHRRSHECSCGARHKD